MNLLNFQNFLKRPRVWGSLVSIVVMMLIAMAFFYPDNVEGNVLKQGDVIQGMANGEEARAYKEETGITTRWTNSLFSGMPTFQISPSYPSSSLLKWINSVYSCGLPGCSGLIMMMMLGMYIMLISIGKKWYLALIGAVAWGFSSYYIIIIAAGHLWKFYTLAYVPPTIAGVILAYRGRLLPGAALTAFGMTMQFYWNHPQMTYYFGFLIVILAISYLVVAFRTKAMRGWLTASGVIILATMLGVAANAPNLYFTSKYSSESIRGGHSELTLDNQDDKSTSGGLDKEYITQYSYGKVETFSLMIPDIKGGTSKSLDELPGAKEKIKEANLNDAEKQFLKYHTQYFGGEEGTSGPVYVGVIICALFLLGCLIVRGPLKWALIAATILSIGLAWGRNFMPLTDLFLSLVPGYNKFRTPESILVVAQFTMPLMAVLALCTLFSTRNRRQLLKPFYIAFGIVAGLCFIGWIAPGFYGSTQYVADPTPRIMNQIEQQYPGQNISEAQISLNMIGINSNESLAQADEAVAPVVKSMRRSLVSSDSMRSLLFVLLAGALIFWWLKGGKKEVVIGALGILILVDLYGIDKRYINHKSFNKPVEQTITPTAADSQILADPDPYYRVVPLDNFSSPVPSYFHKSVGGYHAAKLARYNDILEKYLYPGLSGSASPQMQKAASNVLNMLNAKYFINGPSATDVYPNPDALGNAWFVDNISYVDSPDDEFLELSVIDPASQAVADKKFEKILGTSRPVAPGDFIRLTSYAPDKLSYKARSTNGGVAVFSDVFFPWGWEATIDGKPVEIGRVNYILRAIPVPAGDHEIIMSFNPPVKAVDTIATVAIFILYILIYILIMFSIVRPKCLNRGKKA